MLNDFAALLPRYRGPDCNLMGIASHATHPVSLDYQDSMLHQLADKFQTFCNDGGELYRAYLDCLAWTAEEVSPISPRITGTVLVIRLTLHSIMMTLIANLHTTAMRTMSVWRTSRWSPHQALLNLAAIPHLALSLSPISAMRSTIEVEPRVVARSGARGTSARTRAWIEANRAEPRRSTRQRDIVSQGLILHAWLNGHGANHL
jgi:hypothetical protein